MFVVIPLTAEVKATPAAIGTIRAFSTPTVVPFGAVLVSDYVAAMKPRFVTREDVPADVLAGERRIAEETARQEGKPEQALARIVEGRLNGFFKDVVLLEQPSVTESKKNVQAVLDEAGTRVKGFVRFEVGG